MRDRRRSDQVRGRACGRSRRPTRWSTACARRRSWSPSVARHLRNRLVAPQDALTARRWSSRPGPSRPSVPATQTPHPRAGVPSVVHSLSITSPGESFPCRYVSLLSIEFRAGGSGYTRRRCSDRGRDIPVTVFRERNEREGLLPAHYPFPDPDGIRPVFGSVAADLGRTAVSSPVPAPLLRRYSEK